MSNFSSGHEGKGFGKWTAHPQQIFLGEPLRVNKSYLKDVLSLRLEVTIVTYTILTLLLGRVDTHILLALILEQKREKKKKNMYLHAHYQSVGFTIFEGRWLEFSLNFLKCLLLNNSHQLEFIFLFLRHDFSAVFVYGLKIMVLIRS